MYVLHNTVLLLSQTIGFATWHIFTTPSAVSFQLSVMVVMACSASAAPALFKLNGMLNVTLTMDEGNGVLLRGRKNSGLIKPRDFERPSDFISNWTHKRPLCEPDPMSGFTQYDKPIRYPGILDPVRCTQCALCPNGTTWSPVVIKYPVFTQMFETNDPDENVYVMDIINYPVTCACLKLPERS